MSSNDLLSQDEIDALLHGVDLGEPTSELGYGPATGEAALYDFLSQDRVVPGRLPALETISQHFARGLGAGMSDLFCSKVEISANGIQFSKFAGFVRDLHVPTSLNLVAMKPLPGAALIALDPMLVFRTIECFFGGDGQCIPIIEPREFTATEQKVIQQLLDQAIHNLQQAWSAVMSLQTEWLGAEPGPNYDNVFDAAEAMVIAGFTVRFPAGGGELQLAMPYAMLEPVFDRLGGRVTDTRGRDDTDWRDATRERLQDARIEISGTLVETTITLRQLARLRAGDVISVEIPDRILLRAEQRPVYWGEFGVHGGRYAIKIGGPYGEQ